MYYECIQISEKTKDGRLRKWIFFLCRFLLVLGGVYVIIQSGNVSMSSRRSYERTSAFSSSLSLWGNGFLQNKSIQSVSRYSEKSNYGQQHSDSSAKNSKKDLFHQFKQAQSIGNPVSITRTSSDSHKLKTQSLSYLLMLLFGGQGERPNHILNMSNASTAQQFGGSYTESGYYSEQETTSFSTTGTVKTGDGREINFNLSMTMSRSFEEAYTGSVDFGAALNQAALCDPLVINLNTASANVTDQSFYFDLDADGTMDRISNLSAGSGFLALDKNGDGIINDGSELFGTKSGDGFADLAAYDADGNGWIDENDPIFDKLVIWTKDARGKDVLCAIGKAGIGAIYLGNAQTDFAMKSSKDNSTNALVRKTGIFLYENGSCGTVQHLDMALKA